MYDVAVEAYLRLSEVIRDGATIDEVLDVTENLHTAVFTIYDDLLHG